MNDTKGVLAQGSQVETKKPQVRTVDFAESLEIIDRIGFPEDDKPRVDFERLNPQISDNKIQGSVPFDDDMNSVHTVKFSNLDGQPITIPLSIDLFGGQAKAVTESFFSTLQTITSIAETTTKDTLKEGVNAGRDLLGQIIGTNEGPTPTNPSQIQNEAEQKKLANAVAIRQLYGFIEQKMAEVPQQKAATSALDAIRNNVNPQDREDANRKRHLGNASYEAGESLTINEIMDVARVDSEEQKVAVRAKEDIETKEIQGAKFKMGEGEAQKADEQGPNHPIKATG